MILHILFLVLCFHSYITKALENEIILEYHQDKIDESLTVENEIKRIFKENKLEIRNIKKINTRKDRMFYIVRINERQFDIVKYQKILEKESKSFVTIRENKIYNEKNDVNTIPERNLDFLKEEDAKKLDILKNYLSTKYKFWESGIKGKNVKVAIFDSGLSNEHSNCNLTELSNFTEENEKDQNGHGTHITSVILKSI
jgi:subtilisin family serine protease